MQSNEDFKRQQQEVEEEVNNLEEQELPTANIIVAGITGTGKSTLLNAVFGEEFAKTGVGRPITANMNVYDSPDIPVRIWDTVGLELDSEKTKDSIREIKKYYHRTIKIKRYIQWDSRYLVLYQCWQQPLSGRRAELYQRPLRSWGSVHYCLNTMRSERG